jgi:hypothetical protein
MVFYSTTDECKDLLSVLESVSTAVIYMYDPGFLNVIYCIPSIIQYFGNWARFHPWIKM